VFPTAHGIVSQGGKGAAPQPPSGIQIVGVTTGANAGGDVSVSYPAGVQAGDVLVIFLTYGGSLFQSAGRAPGFDVLAMAGGAAPLLMLVRTADGEETGVTFSLNRNVAWVAYALRGAVAWPHAEIESLVAASIDPPSLTPSWGSSANLWLAAAKF